MREHAVARYRFHRDGPLDHMRNTLVGFSNAFYAIPYFAAVGNEVVIRIDDIVPRYLQAHLFGYAVKM